MAVNRTLLMAIAACLLLGGTDALAAGLSCLQCHRPHYEAVGGCVSCHGGDPRSDRLSIAHHDLIPARFSWFSIPGAAEVQRGNELLKTYACRRCHTTAGKGNRLASNLDRLPAGTTPQELFGSIKSPALLMPEFRFDEGQMTDLVNAIWAGARESRQKGVGVVKESPQVVHFEAQRPDQENIFEKRCGPCHKMLTRSMGGVGHGSIGPNLSGLLSEQYPETAANKSRWSAAALEKWLKNPRQSRIDTRMRPVSLQKGEFERLLALLSEAAPQREP